MNIWKIALYGTWKWTVYMAFPSYPTREQVLDCLRRKYPRLDRIYIDLVKSGAYDCDHIEVIGL